MKYSLGFLAAILGLMSQSHAMSWTSPLYVDKLLTIAATESITGNPVVEVWQVTLSSGNTYAFYNKNSQQQINLLTMAMSQGKKVQILYSDTQTLEYTPKECFDKWPSYTCQYGSDQSLPALQGVTLCRL